MKEIWTHPVKRVISEPGDNTRYDYLVYQNPRDNVDFSFAPCESTFMFPQKLDYWSAIAILDDEDSMKAAIKAINDDHQLKNVNPYTLLECCRTIKQIKDEF
jgi:hypothetical protein